jgi:hypothetical protein
MGKLQPRNRHLYMTSQVGLIALFVYTTSSWLLELPPTSPYTWVESKDQFPCGKTRPGTLTESYPRGGAVSVVLSWYITHSRPAATLFRSNAFQGVVALPPLLE